MKPEPENWTLRFKAGKGIVFLHTDPMGSFSEIRERLLDALRDLPEDSATIQAVLPLPDDPENIVLGLPIDKNNLEKGWIPLDIPETHVEVKQEGAKGIKKETRVVGGPDSVLNSSPKSAGLRDGAALTFRFKTGAEIASGDIDPDMWSVELPGWQDDEELESEMDDVKATPGQSRLPDRAKP